MPDTILLIADDPAGRGGIECRLLQTATSLSRERWRPLVIVPTDGYLYRMLSDAGVNTRLLNLYRFPRLWRVRRYFPIDAWVTILVNMVRFRRILKQEKVFLVHTVAKQTFNVRNVAWAARTMGVPVIWSCGDTNPQVLTYCRGGLGSMLARVIAISHYVKDTLIRSGLEPSDNIEVLHNAIDLEDWDKQTSAMDGSLREDLGMPADRPIVGLVARLDRVKGQDAFLLAAEQVAGAHPSALFLLVGVIRPTSRWAVFADYFREVEALAERPALRGRVIFTGWRDDLPRVMAAVDILVQPSRRETFGRVLIEAMASRKPVIVTRVGGMPEIVVDGETGFVVTPDDPSGLAAAILRLLQDPAGRRAMGEAGRKRVEQHFSLPRRIRRLESIYRQVLDARTAEHEVERTVPAFGGSVALEGTQERYHRGGVTRGFDSTLMSIAQKDTLRAAATGAQEERFYSGSKAASDDSALGQPAGSRENRVVFIVGSGHTGSTLLSLILTGHSRLLGLSESAFFDQWARNNDPCSCGVRVRSCPLWSAVQGRIASRRGFEMTDFAREFPIDLGGAFDRSTPMQRIAYRVSIAGVRLVPASLWRRAAEATPLAAVLRRARNALEFYDCVSEISARSILVDASKSAYRLLYAHLLRPEAMAAVYLTRDGRAVTHSLMKGKRYSAEAAARRWRSANRYTRWMLGRLPRARWLHIRYEELCQDPAAVTARLCDFIGVPFESEMLRLGAVERHFIGGNDMQYRRQTEVRENTSWRQQMSANALQTFERIGGRLNRRLMGDYFRE